VSDAADVVRVGVRHGEVGDVDVVAFDDRVDGVVAGGGIDEERTGGAEEVGVRRPRGDGARDGNGETVHDEESGGGAGSSVAGGSGLRGRVQVLR
jgi:hypothetical protein